MTIDQILERLPGARKNGAGWMARCPAHEDKNPSLSINVENGRVLLHCHALAGCTIGSICSAMGISQSDLFLNGTRSGSTGRTEKAIYDYTDENGKLLFQVVRYEPKAFKQRRPDGSGGWLWNLDDTRRVLYRLPEVLPDFFVLIVEGEKDVETARSLGVTATCNPGGAGKWRPEYSEVLRGKTVVIIADADGSGRKHAQEVVDSLRGKAASLKVIELPGSKDLTQWAEENGGTFPALIKIIHDALEWRPREQDELKSLSTGELFSVQEAQIDWLAWPFSAVGLATIIDAAPKIGKTRFFLEGIRASRLDRPFLGTATRPMRVIYVSEQSATSLAVQVREVGFTGSETIEELRWLTREHWSRFVFSEFLERLETQFIRNGSYNALIFDCWHTIARLQDENDAGEVNRIGNLTLDVAARNKLGLSLGRHDRKSGGEIGMSGRSSIQLSGLVDVILHLVRVPEKPTQRRLEMIGRVPGLPTQQIIALGSDQYINLGEPLENPLNSRVEHVAEWLLESPNLTGEEIVRRFAALMPPVRISLASANRYKKAAMR